MMGATEKTYIRLNEVTFVESETVLELKVSTNLFISSVTRRVGERSCEKITVSFVSYFQK